MNNELHLGDFQKRCSQALPPPSGGRRGGGQWRWPWDTGAQRMPRFPPSNLSCATAWAQRASRFPPLGGGKECVHTAADHNEGGSFQEIALVGGVRLVPRWRKRLWPWVHAGDGQCLVFHGQCARCPLRFRRHPPLRFVVLLLLAGSFLFTLLKGRARFLRHRVPSLQCFIPRPLRMPVRYAVSCSPASARRRAP